MPIYKQYAPFLKLRQSEISNKISDILADGKYDQVWLHKAAWRACLFLKLCNKEECFDKDNNFIFYVPVDILLGLHVIMLDINWFYEEFLPNNNFVITKKTCDFEGTGTL